MSVGMGPQSWKQCPRCGAANHLDAQACACGHQFSTRFVANQTTAFNATIQAPPVQQQPPNVNYLDQSTHIYMAGQQPAYVPAAAQRGCGEYVLYAIGGALGCYPPFGLVVAVVLFVYAQSLKKLRDADPDPYSRALYDRRILTDRIIGSLYVLWFVIWILATIQSRALPPS